MHNCIYGKKVVHIMVCKPGMIKKLFAEPVLFLPTSIKLRCDVLIYHGNAPRWISRTKWSRLKKKGRSKLHATGDLYTAIRTTYSSKIANVVETGRLWILSGMVSLTSTWTSVVSESTATIGRRTTTIKVRTWVYQFFKQIN